MKYTYYIFICILLVVLPLRLAAQFSADFSVPKTNGCAPFIVEFENTTPDFEGVSYYWDLGNGNSSTVKNPIATYTNKGSYTISLTVSDGEKTQVVKKIGYINTHAVPTIDILNKDSITECAPLTIDFQSSTDDSHIKNTYLWDFGDGVQSSEVDPSHTYTNDGVYNVSLLMANQYGCINQVTYENIITISKPKVKFFGESRASCQGSMYVTFINQSIGRGDLSYLWNFGNGRSSTLENAIGYFDEVGHYNVQLIATDAIGCRDTLERLDYIRITDTLSDFTFSKDTICPNEEVVFTNLSHNASLNLWDFGDGTTSSEVNPTHIYSQAGNYLVKLIVENRFCTDTLTKQIHVEEVIASFNTDIDYSCELPVTVSYQNTSRNAIAYQWKFGNQNTSVLQNPRNTITKLTDEAIGNIESFTDELIVTSKYGCKSSVKKVNNITINIPKVSISGDTKLCIPTEEQYKAVINYDSDKDEMSSYTWNLDSVEVSDSNQFVKNITEVGRYTLQVVLETTLGCTASSTLNISAGVPLDANFNINNKTEFCVGELVGLENTTQPIDKVHNFNWDYGDGQVSFLPELSHSYQDSGYFDVTLMVYNYGCMSTITKEEVLYVNTPIVGFDRIDICNRSLETKFEADVIGATSYQWDFGDGSTIDESIKEVTHSFDSVGDYVVSLSAQNSNTQCTTTKRKLVKVRQLSTVFDTIRAKPCANSLITFNPINSSHYDIISLDDEDGNFMWDFGDRSNLVLSDSTIDYTYKEGGDYIATLITNDINGCADSVSMPITVYDPRPELSINYTQGCMPVTFQFTDETIARASIKHWEWDFGDGSSSNVQNPSHNFNSFQKFDISLTVTDENNCTNAVTKSKAVDVINPDASFVASDFGICVGDSITFFDESLSNIQQFEWIFEEGDTINISNPSYTYNQPGEFNVTLNIIDDHGCEASHIKSEYVKVQEPASTQFSADQTKSNCYPFTVKFQDKSMSAHLHKWQWFFGDNLTESNIRSPKHMYTKPGLYDVTLITETSHGCSDTLIHKDLIEIGGPYAEINIKDSSCVYNAVSFNLQNEENIQSVFWDFGDGMYSTDQTPTHKYSQGGYLYPSIVLFTDSKYNCNKVIKDTLFIDALKAKINFEDDKGEGCVPYLANVQNTTDRSVSSQWYYLDNKIASDPYHSKVFYEVGNHYITLVAESDLGCKDTVSSNIKVNPLPDVSISNDTLICRGDNVMLWAEGGVDYFWSRGNNIDNNSISNPIVNPIVSSTYKVSVTDYNGCVNIDSLIVNVQQEPLVQMSDTVLIIGETLSLDIASPEIKSYLWSPNYGLNCTDCAMVDFNPIESQQYYLEVTDTADCFQLSYPFYIEIQKKYSVDVPTAFTPNGDGINDVIWPKGWGIKQVLSFNIYNKHGLQVFQSSLNNIKWDGNYKDIPQSIDTYSYKVRVLNYDNKMIQKNGKIQLIR